MEQYDETLHPCSSKQSISLSKVWWAVTQTRQACEDADSTSFLWARGQRNECVTHSTGVMLPSGKSVDTAVSADESGFPLTFSGCVLQVPHLSPLPLYTKSQSCYVEVLISDMPRGRVAPRPCLCSLSVLRPWQISSIWRRIPLRTHLKFSFPPHLVKFSSFPSLWHVQVMRRENNYTFIMPLYSEDTGTGDLMKRGLAL